MPQSLRHCFTLLAVTAIAMAALLALLPAAGHDQLWFLLMARRWLGGAQLYGPQIFDSNPPFVVWLSAIPVLLASSLHISVTTAAKSVVLLGTLGVAAFSYRLLPRAWRPIESGERTALLFAFLVIAFVLPARDLGQRDALAGLLALPYVLAATPGSGHSALRTQRLAAVILAAFAFCLKPQDALIAVSIEAFCLLWLLLAPRRAIRQRKPANADLLPPSSTSRTTPNLSSRPEAQSAAVERPASPATKPQPQSAPETFRWLEVLVLLAGGTTYFLAIRRFTPLYLTSALPILHLTYWAVGHLSLPSLLWEAIELFVLAAMVAFLILRYPPRNPAPLTLAIAGLGALAAYLAQGTGWYYQQLPALTFFAAALTLYLLDLQQRHTVHPPSWFPAALASVCLLAVVLTTHFMGYPFTTDRAFDLHSPDPAFFAHLAPGTPVAILTTSVDEAMMPIERFHLTWAQRTNNLWLLPAILRSEALGTADPHRRLTPLELARLRDTQQRWMVEDLRRWYPELVLVERCQDPAIHCQVLEDRHDNLLAWFGRDANFRQVWQSYRFAGTRDRFDAYVLQRTPPSH